MSEKSSGKKGLFGSLRMKNPPKDLDKIFDQPEISRTHSNDQVTSPSFFQPPDEVSQTPRTAGSKGSLSGSQTSRPPLKRQFSWKSIFSDEKAHLKPTVENVNSLLESLMEKESMPAAERAQLRKAGSEVKWNLLQDYHVKHCKMTPIEIVINLKKKPEQHMENLVFALKSANGIWVKEFCIMGGVNIIYKNMETTLEKLSSNRINAKQKQKYAVFLQNMILSAKAMMLYEEGIDAVIAEPNLAQSLFRSVEHLGDRAKVVVLHLLGALCTLDEKLHSEILLLLQQDIFIFLKIASSTNQEVASAGFTCLNAMVLSDRHDIEDLETIKTEVLKKGLARIAQAWKNRRDLGDAMRTQIDVFELNVGPDFTKFIDSPVLESSETLFKRVMQKIKGSPVVDRFNAILQHLLDVSFQGKGGFNKWDLIDEFVRSSSRIEDKDAVDRAKGLQLTIQQLEGFENHVITSKGDKSAEIDSLNERWKKANRRVTTVQGKKGILRSARDLKGSARGSLSDTFSESMDDRKDDSMSSRESVDEMKIGESSKETSELGGISESGPSPPTPSAPSGPSSGGPPPPTPPGGPGGPPPPPGGGPPPPPPPGGPPPPPPPGGPGGAIAKPAYPPKEIPVTPSTKIRPLHWNKIPARSVKGTIWESMKDNIYIPQEAIEKEFCLIAKEGKASKIDTSEAKTIILLEQKRWQNVSIILSRFTNFGSLDEIRDSILNLDEEKLDLDDLTALAPFSPQPEEIELLKPYKSMRELPENLGVPEQFFIELMDIPDIKSRLDCWLFKQAFAVRFMEVKQTVETLLRSCVGVKKNMKLKRVLEIVLAFGNFMNHDSNRGGAWGFKLNSLLKLGEIRAHSDATKTVLHYIVEFVEDVYPEALSFHEDMEVVQKVGEMQQLSVIRDELKGLEAGIHNIENFLNTPSAKAGRFTEVMSKFIPTSKKLVEKIRELFTKGEVLFKELVSYFGESDTCTLDELFGTLHQFSQQFNRTHDDILKRREFHARQQQRLEEKALRQNQKTKSGGKQLGRLEQAIADITTGDAYSWEQKKRLNKNNNSQRSGDQSSDKLKEALAFLKK